MLGGGGGGHSLMWPIRASAASQGMVFFCLFSLNSVYNFRQVFPKQGLNLSYTGQGCTTVAIKYGLSQTGS